MSENKTNILKHSLMWGLIAGTIIIIISLVVYMTGMKLGESKLYQWSQVLIIIAMIVVSQIQFRNNGERFGYGRILGVGLLTGISAALILGVYNYLFFKVIAPDVLVYIKQQAELALVEADIPDEALEKAIEMQAKFMKPGIMAVMNVFQISFMSLFGGLISSAFIKPRKDIFNNNEIEETIETE